MFLRRLPLALYFVFAALAAGACVTFHESDDLPNCSRLGVCHCLSLPGCTYCEDNSSCAQVNSRKCAREVFELPSACVSAPSTDAGADAGTLVDAGAVFDAGVISDCADAGSLTCGQQPNDLYSCEPQDDALRLRSFGRCPDGGQCVASDPLGLSLRCTSVPGAVFVRDGADCQVEGARGCDLADRVVRCTNNQYRRVSTCSSLTCREDSYRPPDSGSTAPYTTCAGDGLANIGDDCYPEDRPSACSLNRGIVLGCNAGKYVAAMGCSGGTRCVDGGCHL